MAKEKVFNQRAVEQEKAERDRVTEYHREQGDTPVLVSRKQGKFHPERQKPQADNR